MNPTNVSVSSCANHTIHVTRVSFTKEQVLRALDIVADEAYAAALEASIKAEEGIKQQDIKDMKQGDMPYEPVCLSGIHHKQIGDSDDELFHDSDAGSDGVVEVKPKWYSVTTGREVGVYDDNAEALSYVLRVSGGLMTRFSSQAGAVAHFRHALLDGRVHRIHDGTVTHYNTENGGLQLKGLPPMNNALDNPNGKIDHAGASL
ncbi:hypothetical protein BJ138DRAFT_1106926 [Hygrophoropsis aurantiaca]|uniref:Uncharacterized protein n=1 Tax=Hygrophoropsis aurantiaca TaxID=72124 RepID=A0ACB7ZTB9_9AGAM|nr:hypothetical protein BJ138DRAFT_1106926 [Hygrophoropsis aurantiaca]